MSAAVVEWGLAELPLPGETDSGDRCVVLPADSRATFAVIDGLGHGREAASASRAAAEVLEAHPDEGVLPLFRRCHERLRRTRGAAMTLARYDAGRRRLRWLGAGSVRAVLLRPVPGGTAAYRDMLVFSGALGLRLPTLEVSALDVQPGDLLFLATDGLRHEFAEALRHDEPPQAQAERLLASFRKLSDDAMVLVVRIAR